MEKFINDFICYLKIERQYARNTCQAYAADLAGLLEFSNSRNIKKWQELTTKHLNLLVMQMRHKDIAASSIHRYISSIHSFLTYLIHQGVLENNCATQLKIPKIAKNLPDVLTYEQILLMLKPQTSKPAELRDAAIIEVLYSCGLRVAELVGLNVTDIDFEQGFLRVTGKAAKVRYTPLGEPAQAALKAYLAQHAAKSLFVNNKQLRISVRSVENIVKNRALIAGIKVNVYPHMLRHAAATHFLQSSHDLRSTQEFLGHKSIKSTQIYTHLDFLELSKVYDKCHPRAKK